MTRTTTAQHWVLVAALFAWTVGSFGPAPVFAEDLLFAGAGRGEDPRGDLYYGFALAATERRDTGVVIVRYSMPNRDGLRKVRTEISDIEPTEREDEVIAYGESTVELTDGVETRTPTMVRLSAAELELTLALSDRVVVSNPTLVLGGNNPPVPLPRSPLVLVAAIGVNLETGDTFAMGAALSDEDGDKIPREIVGPACGRAAAVVHGDNRTISIDAAPAWGEFGGALHSNQASLEMKFSGPSTVTTDGGETCQADWFLALENDGEGGSFTFAVPDCDAAAAGPIPDVLYDPADDIKPPTRPAGG